jgi:hypothetical protein
MAHNERSSPEMASLASRAMSDPASLSLDEIRSLGASVLTQAPDHDAPNGSLAEIGLWADRRCNAMLGAYAYYNPDNAMANPGTLARLVLNGGK